MASEVVSIINCSKTNECKNIKCFWYLRDVYGYPPFWYENREYDINKILDNIKINLAEIYFPNLKTQVGTNCIYVICEDFKEKREI